MTDTRMAASSLEQPASPRTQAMVVACSHCRKRLAQEFFFTCLRCEASYCYIHMSRHQPALCARQVRKNRREAVAEPRALSASDLSVQARIAPFTADQNSK